MVILCLRVYMTVQGQAVNNQNFRTFWASYHPNDANSEVLYFKHFNCFSLILIVHFLPMVDCMFVVCFPIKGLFV